MVHFDPIMIAQQNVLGWYMAIDIFLKILQKVSVRLVLISRFLFERFYDIYPEDICPEDICSKTFARRTSARKTFAQKSFFRMTFAGRYNIPENYCQEEIFPEDICPETHFPG
jgi:hypothetical protein